MDARRFIVVCAMASEARALIEHFGLVQRRAEPFRLYSGARHHLVISGLGSHASATAVGYAAAALEAGPRDLWFNFGIAGHGTLPLGTTVVAARIAHHGRDEAWYPALAVAPPCPTASVLSHDSVVSDYPSGACVDMEASGFMAAATRFAPPESVHAMKVVSDNAEQNATQVTRAQVEALTQAAVPAFTALLTAAQASLPHALDAAAQPALHALLARCHFTEAQGAQLRQAWQRLLLHRAPVPDLDDCLNARHALARLRAQIDALPVAHPHHRS